MRSGSGQRAAIYARFSTDLQTDRSIDDQLALCREHAGRLGLTVVATYTDRARTSASLIGRDGILRLMEDARAGRFDLVVVEALDRLSRDQEDLAGIHKRLDFAGIGIEAVHDGRADAIQVGIRGLVGHLFLADLKHKVRRGMQGVVRDGRSAGGRAYGYAPVPGQPGELTVVEAEAAVVRRIFGEYLAGDTPRTIAGRLNAEGVPPPRGARWNASTINGNAERGYGILLNPLYSGKIVWNRVRMVRDPDTGRRISRVNPEAEWQSAGAPQLAIIDADTWAAAQARKAARSRLHQSRRDQHPRRPFSGLLRCGSCGAGMSIHDRSGSAVRIRCSAATESQSCDNDRRYRLDRIESAIIAGLQEQLRHPELLREYLRVYREERHGAITRAQRDRRQLERAARRARETFDRQLRLYGDGVIDGDEARVMIHRLQGEARAAEAALAQASAEVPVIDLHPQAVERYAATIETLAERLADPDPKVDAATIEALRRIIVRITVSPGTGRAALVEVTGWLSALTGEPEKVGGLVVAEEGLEPPTRGL